MTVTIRFEDLPPRNQATKVFEGAPHADVSFFLVDLPPGEGPPLHVHPYREVFVVQEGKATFTVGEDTLEAAAGNIVIAPADVPHVNSGEGRLRSVNIHPVPRMVTEWLEE